MNIAQLQLPQTLKRVLLEVTFPSSLRISRDVCDFQTYLGEDYVYSIAEGNQKAGAIGRSGYQFRHKDGNYDIRLFEDSLTVAATREYSGFEDFGAFCVGLVTSVVTLGDLRVLTRVGLRYENVIYVFSEDDTFSVSVLPGLHLDSGNLDVQELNEFMLLLKTGGPGAGLTIRSSFQIETVEDGDFKGQRYGIYLLDFDAFRAEEVAADGFSEILSALHESIQNAYQRNIQKEQS